MRRPASARLARAPLPAPAGRRRRTSPRACAPWQVLRPRRFAPTIADHTFDLQRIVLVDEQVLDEGRLAVTDRLTVRLRFLGGPPVNLDVLDEIVEDDVR